MSRGVLKRTGLGLHRVVGAACSAVLIVAACASLPPNGSGMPSPAEGVVHVDQMWLGCAERYVERHSRRGLRERELWHYGYLLNDLAKHCATSEVQP